MASSEPAGESLADLCADLGYAVETVSALDADAVADAARAFGADAIYAEDPAAWPAVLAASKARGLASRLCELDDAALWGVWETLIAAGTPVVETRYAKDLPAAEVAIAEIGTPCRLRSFGGLALPCCFRLDHADDLPLLFAKASEAFAGGGVLVQAPAHGDTHRVVGFKCGRDFFPVEALREWTSDGPFCFPEALGAGEDIAGAPYEAIFRLARRAASALPPGNGPIEIEINLSGETPTLTGLRVWPGIDPAVDTVLRLALGIEFQADALRLAMGDSLASTPRSGLAAIVRWISARSGVVESIEGIHAARALPGIAHIEMRAQPGDILGHAVNAATRDRVGYVAATGSSLTAAARAAEEACALISVVTRPTEP